MYHIPHDLRARKSADAIYKALLELLESRSLNDVSISDITKNCGVSRSTFYRLFDNVSDVVIWKCECIIDDALDTIGSGKINSFEETFEAFAQSWFANKTLLEALSRSSRMDILYNMHASRIDAIKESFSEKVKIEGIQQEYVCAIITWILPACFQVWLEHPEDLNRVYKHIHDSFYSLEKIFR